MSSQCNIAIAIVRPSGGWGTVQTVIEDYLVDMFGVLPHDAFAAFRSDAPVIYVSDMGHPQGEDHPMFDALDTARAAWAISVDDTYETGAYMEWRNADGRDGYRLVSPDYGVVLTAQDCERLSASMWPYEFDTFADAVYAHLHPSIEAWEAVKRAEEANR